MKIFLFLENSSMVSLSIFSGYKLKVDIEFPEDCQFLSYNELKFAFNATCMWYSRPANEILITIKLRCS